MPVDEFAWWPPSYPWMLGTPDDAETRRMRRALAGARLPRQLERWRVELPAGAERSTDAAEWAGAIVLVEAGEVRVRCTAGGSCTFVAGDILALGWVPVQSLHNPGPGPARLLATRRRRPLDPPHSTKR